MQNTNSKILIFALLLLLAGAACNQITIPESPYESDKSEKIEITIDSDLEIEQVPKVEEELPPDDTPPPTIVEKKVEEKLEIEDGSTAPIDVVPQKQSRNYESKYKNNTDKEKRDVLITSFLVQDEEYNIEIPEGSTGYDLMQSASTQSNFTFSAKNFPGLGYFIEEINGQKNDHMKGIYWIYYINGEKAKVGISNYLLTNGDIIEWKYENEKF